MKNTSIKIKVDGGGVFEGDFGHWEDVFFSFPDCFETSDRIDSVKSYCKKMNWKVEIECPTRSRIETFTIDDLWVGSAIFGLGCLFILLAFYAVNFLVDWLS